MAGVTNSNVKKLAYAIADVLVKVEWEYFRLNIVFLQLILILTLFKYHISFEFS